MDNLPTVLPIPCPQERVGGVKEKKAANPEQRGNLNTNGRTSFSDYLTETTGQQPGYGYCYLRSSKQR